MFKGIAAVGSLPTLTVALIIASVMFAFGSNLGSSVSALLPFFIAAPGSSLLADLRAGEVWRLITPIFIHFGILHLAFNMMWLWDLGGLLERRRGFWFLTGFVAVVGIAANLAQYFIGG